MPTCMHVVLFQPEIPPNTGNVADCAPPCRFRCISSSLWASSLRTVTSNGRASTIGPMWIWRCGPTSTPTSGTPGRADGSSSPAPAGTRPAPFRVHGKRFPRFRARDIRVAARSDRALAASCPHPHQRRSPQHQPFHCRWHRTVSGTRLRRAGWGVEQVRG